MQFKSMKMVSKEIKADNSTQQRQVTTLKYQRKA